LVISTRVATSSTLHCETKSAAAPAWKKTGAKMAELVAEVLRMEGPCSLTGEEDASA